MRGYTSAIGAIVSTICAISCGGDRPAAETDRPVTTSTQERDIHSYARPHEVRVTHVALDLTADFDARVLSGTALLKLQRNGSANQVVLDTKGLDVQRVTAGDTELKFALGAEDKILGRALTVELPAGATEITVTYRTSPD